MSLIECLPSTISTGNDPKEQGYSSFASSYDQHQTILCVSLGIKATLLERYAGEARKVNSCPFLLRFTPAFKI